MTIANTIKCAVIAAAFSLAGSPAFATDTTFFVILKGGNEVSATGAANAGDQDGYGSASVLFRTNARLCYSILAFLIEPPNAAHIHRGPAGVNGPIVVNLRPPSAGSLGQGSVSDCISIDGALGAEIRNNPSGFYINVHNAPFPSGAVRGQLF